MSGLSQFHNGIRNPTRLSVVSLYKPSGLSGLLVCVLYYKPFFEKLNTPNSVTDLYINRVLLEASFTFHSRLEPLMRRRGALHPLALPLVNQTHKMLRRACAAFPYLVGSNTSRT